MTFDPRGAEATSEEASVTMRHFREGPWVEPAD